MEAYRSGHLVYIPIAKNASSTFKYVFHEELGWEKTTCDLIDWDSDKVFGHFQHPYRRHVKGLAEAMYRYGFQDLVNDHRLRRLMATAVFDVHSYPIVPTLGQDWASNIDWIIMDHPCAATDYRAHVDYLTNKFLNHHGVKIDVTHHKRRYTSSKQKLALERQLVKIRDEWDMEDTLTHFYDRDVVLWNQLEEQTFYWEDTWEQISWLTHKVKWWLDADLVEYYNVDGTPKDPERTPIKIYASEINQYRELIPDDVLDQHDGVGAIIIFKPHE